MVLVALIHYPVVNARGEVIASAVANLDLHDLARICRTYGVERFLVVTPLEDQQELVEEIRRHWVEGGGGRRNPHRREAMERLELLPSLESAVARARELAPGELSIYATSAREGGTVVEWEEARRALEAGRSLLLLFGTAHGLAPQVTACADGLLPPIRRGSSYRHLPVRAAVAVVLDRLLGDGAAPPP